MKKITIKYHIVIWLLINAGLYFYGIGHIIPNVLITWFGYGIILYIYTAIRGV